MQKKLFELKSSYLPCGDQPNAISKLAAGLSDGLAHQVLLGVTGSGKTFTIANIINQLQRPTIILAHNKTLAAQLYGEMKEFFPNNAVEYFVSYYDYYQPEAYVPASDTYIEKDSAINEHIERMRLSATKAILERNDCIIVASVSAIYGLGSPQTYLSMVLHLSVNDTISQRTILKKLSELQYSRNDMEFTRATYRVRGDVIDVHPAELDNIGVRICLFGDEIEELILFDALTQKTIEKIPRITVYPKTHYVTPREIVLGAIDKIKIDLKERLNIFENDNKLIEAQRLRERTMYDLEMLQELGYCNGIENYSRYLSERDVGQAPPTLLDYLPANALMIIDESHVTVSQIGAMYKGDRSRKENLVNYGFRLPSALDNRPLKFEEFLNLQPQTIYVSATPADYELALSDQTVEQVVRPTGLLDPIVEVRSAITQVDDVLSEIRKCINQNERVLITTLTKKMAEDLTDYLHSYDIKVRYLHSDIDTVERVAIIRDLRLGVCDVLVGINLLREGLDMPEVSLVAILDADKEGFLRSNKSLIQTIGRAARNENGKAILYADKITNSMQYAINETARRRAKQEAHNAQHNIIPTTIKKDIQDIMQGAYAFSKPKNTKESGAYLKTVEPNIMQEIPKMNNKEIMKLIERLEKDMYTCAKNLDFEKAAAIRDKITLAREYMLTN